MNRVYIVTGAGGHLGSTLIRMLKKRHETVRGLVLPTEKQTLPGVSYVRGDVRDRESMRPLFEGLKNREIIVIHAAGLIDLSEHVSRTLYDVNVKGTKNVLSLCQEYRTKRLLYISSVHAIPEQENQPQFEVRRFSPDWVVGGYAKTKAEATQAVLDAARDGLNAVVVHPSGIIGPFDSAHNYLVQLISDYLDRKLPACVRGGYDFVDVRDVAAGCLLAIERGKSGECYILSNQHFEVKELLALTRNVSGGRRLPTLPMWLAKVAAPPICLIAKMRKQRPLYTAYSLYTLSSKQKFSHEKATRDLNYHPRDFGETIRDTVRWLHRQNVVCA